MLPIETVLVFMACVVTIDHVACSNTRDPISCTHTPHHTPCKKEIKKRNSLNRKSLKRMLKNCDKDPEVKLSTEKTRIRIKNVDFKIEM